MESPRYQRLRRISLHRKSHLQETWQVLTHLQHPEEVVVF